MASNPPKDEIYRKYLDARMTEQIRQNSQELRELETKIRTAYVSKALAAQLSEKEMVRLKAQLLQQNEIEQMNQDIMAEKERKRQQIEITKQGQMQLRGELQDQIIEKSRKRKHLYEEFLKEKLIIDEIMRKIQMEQIETSQQKLLESKCLREDIDQLKRDQMKWKAEQEQLAREENEKIVRYIQKHDEKQQQIHEKLAHNREMKNNMQRIMCDQLNDIERRKREQEEVMIDLKCKEIQDKHDILNRVELENRIRRSINTKMQLESQTRDNQLRKLQQKNDDRVFREEQLKLLAERDRLELLSNERQRLKKMEHQRAVRQLMADRETHRCNEVFKFIQEHQDYLAQEKRRQELFEVERLKILRTHADNLLGFLPSELINEANSNEIK